MFFILRIFKKDNKILYVSRETYVDRLYFFESINGFADFCFKYTFLYKRKFDVSRETLLLTSIFIAMYLLN